MSDLCETKWVENFDGYSTLHDTISFIIEILQAIEIKIYLERCREWKE